MGYMRDRCIVEQNWDSLLKEEEGVISKLTGSPTQPHFMPFLFPCDLLGRSATLVTALQFGSIKSVESYGPEF